MARTLVILNAGAGSCSKLGVEPGTLRGEFDTGGGGRRAHGCPETLARLLAPMGEVAVVCPGGRDETLAAASGWRGRGAEVVVAAGGDGTVNAVVNGVMCGAGELGRDHLPLLGVLPLGTGNDLARSLGMPLEPADAVWALAHRRERVLDVVEMRAAPGVDGVPVDGAGAEGGRRFWANTSAGGLVGWIGEATAKERKASLGNAAYLVEAAGVIASMPVHRLRLRIDGEPMEVDATNVVLSNGRTIAGGTPIAPSASVRDGMIDVLVVPPMGVAKLATLGLRVLGGRHGAEDGLVVRRAREVVVEAEPRMAFNSDGDLAGQTPVAHRVRAGALRAIVGDGAPE